MDLPAAASTPDQRSPTPDSRPDRRRNILLVLFLFFLLVTVWCLSALTVPDEPPPAETVELALLLVGR
jgi:hypothetical protein